MRRLEEVSLQPVGPPATPPPMEEIDPPGLPSYEQAIAKSGQHDAPPPPYPGYLHMYPYLQYPPGPGSIWDSYTFTQLH